MHKENGWARAIDEALEARLGPNALRREIRHGMPDRHGGWWLVPIRIRGHRALFLTDTAKLAVADHLARLGSVLRRADDAFLLQFVHQARRARVADAHPPLEKRDRGAPHLPHDPHGLIEELIAGFGLLPLPPLPPRRLRPRRPG